LIDAGEDVTGQKASMKERKKEWEKTAVLML
jgi:hypothetical protein